MNAGNRPPHYTGRIEGVHRPRGAVSKGFEIRTAYFIAWSKGKTALRDVPSIHNQIVGTDMIELADVRMIEPLLFLSSRLA